MEYTNELYHHGRAGQKWGVRNGPPYPLSKGTVKSAYGGSKRSSSSSGRNDVVLTGKPKVKAKSLLTKRKEKKQLKEIEKATKTLEEAIRKREEHINNKERVLREGSAREVYEYRNELTTKELEDVVKRISKRKELEKLSIEESEKGWKAVDRIMKKVGDVKDWTKTGVEMYNAVNSVMNILDKDNAKHNNSGGKK